MKMGSKYEEIDNDANSAAPSGEKGNNAEYGEEKPFLTGKMLKALFTVMTLVIVMIIGALVLNSPGKRDSSEISLSGSELASTQLPASDANQTPNQTQRNEQSGAVVTDGNAAAADPGNVSGSGSGTGSSAAPDNSGSGTASPQTDAGVSADPGSGTSVGGTASQTADDDAFPYSSSPPETEAETAGTTYQADNAVGGTPDSVAGTPVGGGSRTTATANRVSYWIQIGSFSDNRLAHSIKSRFEADGMNVAVTEKLIGGRTLYRVRIGNFASKGEAQREARSIRTMKGFEDSYVVETYL